MGHASRMVVALVVSGFRPELRSPLGGSDSRSESWSRRWDSNPRPSVYETDALPLSYFGAREAG